MTAPTGPYQAGPFDSAHLYLQWGGKLPGNETWSCGIRLAKVGGGTVMGGDPSGLIDAVGAAVSGFHTRAGTNIMYMAKLSFVKLNAISVPGLYMDPGNSFEKVYADVAGAGAGSGGQMPNQVALAVSTVTGFTRGPAHSGRFYLPLPSIALDGDGTISPTAATAVKTSATTFLTELNAAATGYEAAVFSRKSGAPAHRTITGMRVGRILDTQRRRRRSLIEDYR